jgi:hypothetical protein
MNRTHITVCNSSAGLFVSFILITLIKENVMKQLYALFVCAALGILVNPVLAEDLMAGSDSRGATLSSTPTSKDSTAANSGSITITSPVNETVLSDGENKLEFNVHLSPTGHHVHVYIDDQAPIVYRDVSHCPCSIDLPKLSSGKHTIVIKEATSSHALTGAQASVTVTAR